MSTTLIKKSHTSSNKVKCAQNLNRNPNSVNKLMLCADGAPCHTSQKTQKFCREHLKFWKKEMWPGGSPDLNPLDYAFWSYVESLACKKPHSSVGELKKSVDREWMNMSAEYIKKTCDKFTTRINEVILAGGGVIEKWFYSKLCPISNKYFLYEL